MGLINKPQKLEDWNLNVINELINYPDIESENFDFKKEPNELSEHICAMANTVGGFIVLGIEEEKATDGKTIIRFKKSGFRGGEQDYITRQVGNQIIVIEPTPSLNISNILDGDKFFTIIKIENENSKKPFILKDKGQCYVRIHNSSRPASRTTILKLFSSSIKEKKDVEVLKIACLITKELLLHSGETISFTNFQSSMKIPIVDLTLLRAVILKADWFLMERDLLGAHNSAGGYSSGISSTLHKIGQMNTYIKSYNMASNEIERKELKSQLTSWNSQSSELHQIRRLLEDLIKAADDFLKTP